MTATISRRYAFGERVFDATTDEHERALGLSQVRVVIADYAAETINIAVFESSYIARMWVAVEELTSDAEHHIVGDDI